MLMPAASANADVVGFVMGEHSQIANEYAIGEFRKSGNAFILAISHHANMTEDDDDKNGGPNHLKAWMRFRKMNGAKLALALDITPGMVSELANGKRQLNAKWLRRIAPALGTTPGLLLDHNPYELDSDIIEIWLKANESQRKQISELAQVVVKTGT